jgi:broad specificity phosphatase PhoE
MQSAEILGSLLNIPVSSLAELDEIKIPHWDGLTKDEIRHQYGRQYPSWISAPQSFKLPGCETLAQVQKRAVRAINRILAGEQKQNLLLVSHLIVLRCLVLYFQKQEIRDFRSVKIDNGSILQVPDLGKGRIIVSSLQDMHPGATPGCRK